MIKAQLTIIEGNETQTDQVFLLEKEKERVVGRSSSCHFQLLDPLVSSLHCLIFYDEKQEVFTLSDLLSANGILVNDVLVESAHIKPGDKIKLGKTLLEFSEYDGETSGKTYISGEEVNITASDSKIEKEKGEKPAHKTLGRMIRKQKDIIVCRLALKNKTITHDDIKKLLKIQKSQKEEESITSLLITKNLLEKEGVENLLKEHEYFKTRNKDILFGKLIVDHKFSEEDKVMECLKLQERYFNESGKVPRLGEILVQKGYITIKQNNALIKALIKQKYQ